MFDQFDDWLDAGSRFTIGGREFRVEPPSARTVLGIHRVIADGKWNSGVERDVALRILGATWGEMASAGIAELAAMHAGRAILALYIKDSVAAQAQWTLEPEPPASAVVAAPTDLSAPGTYGAHDPGGGPYRPEYGDREWYNPPNMAPAFRKHEKRPDVGWRDILEAWDALELDFQHMGLDLGSDLLDRRTWRWFAVRLSALLGNPAALITRTIGARKADGDGDSAR